MVRNAQENGSGEDSEINLDPPTKDEIELALTQLKNGKAVGLDNINSEVLKFDTAITAEMLYPLLEKIWKEEKIPEEWAEGLIIKIPKKGDLSNCNNWRGITLLSIPSKILTRIILNRIQNTVERHLRKEQAGFRKHRSCVDLINTRRIILEHPPPEALTSPLYVGSKQPSLSICRNGLPCLPSICAALFITCCFHLHLIVLFYFHI
jgi:ribosomal protein L30/L7E